VIGPIDVDTSSPFRGSFKLDDEKRISDWLRRFTRNDFQSMIESPTQILTWLRLPF